MTKTEELAAAARRIWSRHHDGFAFLAARRDGRWIETGFPIDGDGIEDFFTNHSFRLCDLYYCPNAFSRKRRLGVFALPTPYAHCDIDAADPAAFDPLPTLLTETSPGRFQGIWEFSKTVEPTQAEAVSRALAQNGDRGGWSVTKMLRVPGSFNHKDMYDLPVVTVIRDLRTPIAIWPESTKAPVALRGPIGRLCPRENHEAADTDAAMESFRAALKSEPLASRRMWLNVHVVKTNDQRPKDGVARSHVLSQIIRRLRELGLNEGETFTLAWRSDWCKFRVDGRSTDDLWREVEKAYK